MDMTMNDTFLALERRFMEAMRTRDGKSAMELSDDPAVVVGAQGASELPRAQMGAMLASPSWELLAYEIEDLIVREVVPGTVITAYKVTENLTVEGEPLEFEAYEASVWVKREHGWVCSLHTESIAGDPFGRDRTHV